MNRIKSLIITIIIIVALIHANNVFAVAFSPGIKIGLNFYYQHYKKDYWVGEYNKMTYNPGLYIGGFYEIIWMENYSTIVELAFVHKKGKCTVYSWHDDYWDLVSEFKYIHIPLLMKIQVENLFSPYIFLGVDIGRLLWANFKINEHAQTGIWIDEEITHLLPSVDISIDIGIGKKFNIMDHKILLEIRYSNGLTKQQYEYAGNWKNHGIQILIGIQ